DERSDNPAWGEVIPLAATLAGYKSDALVKRLTRRCQQPPEDAGSATLFVGRAAASVLYRCLCDGVQATPSAVRDALREVAREHHWLDLGWDQFAELATGKYGERFREVAEEAYLSGAEGWADYQAAVRACSVRASDGILDQTPVHWLVGELSKD